ncbi:MAG: TerB family tellurite resistance protein [Labrys sp. (in: a-proteobacteria)]
MVLESLQKLFRALSPDGGARHHFDDDDHRVAAAALLVHVTLIDGVQTEAASRNLRRRLMDRFDIEEDEVLALIAAASARDREAIDFHAFTSVLKRTYDDAGRRRLVEMLWELAFADGRVHQFEDDMVWRVADLIGVPSRERIAIRKQIAAERGIAIDEIND